MHLSIKSHLLYTAQQPCDVLLQIEAANTAGQTCKNSSLSIADAPAERIVTGEDGIGTRRWITAGTRFECTFEAQVEISRAPFDLQNLKETPRMDIPGDVIKYLMPSRYCHSELFLDFTASQFGHLAGGAVVCAIRDWIAGNFTYDNGLSHAGTTATDTFASLAGVCRDYAHVMIALLRAVGLPARFVSAYGPDVTPQDFHAAVEVYLDGQWYLVDATGMAEPGNIAIIGVGRDAADASFLTSYGVMDLQQQSVEVSRIGD